MTALARCVVGIALLALVAAVGGGTTAKDLVTVEATPSPATCAALVEDASPVASPEMDAATPVGGVDEAPTDLAGLLGAFEARDIQAETREAIQQEFFNAEQITRLVVTGGPLAGPAELQVYQYVDAETFAGDLNQITPDGNLETVMITWIATPHFFCGERLIVLYLGDDPAAIDMLTELFGPQFAGR
jgi:hypothetical protein